jgi:hypothetical protein
LKEECRELIPSRRPQLYVTSLLTGLGRDRRLLENLFMALRAQESESMRRDTSRTFHPSPNGYPYRGTVAGGLSSWTFFADKANLGCNVQGANPSVSPPRTLSLIALVTPLLQPLLKVETRKVRNKTGGAVSDRYSIGTSSIISSIISSQFIYQFLDSITIYY